MARPGLYMAARRWLGVARYLARRPHDPDFRYFARFHGAGGLFLDVGANSGGSALSYRIFDRSSQIISLEPNPAHEPDLGLVRRIVGRDFSFRLVAAGTEEGELTLFVPRYRGVQLTGEASLHRANADDNWTADELGIPASEVEIEELTVPVLPIDELGLSPHAVKIDVEGAELLVLEGMSATLERSRPALLIEASDDTESVAELLAPLGYEAFVYDVAGDRLERFDGRATTNVIFVADRETAAHPSASDGSPDR